MPTCDTGHLMVSWERDLPVCPLCAALDLADAADEFAISVFGFIVGAEPARRLRSGAAPEHPAPSVLVNPRTARGEVSR